MELPRDSGTSWPDGQIQKVDLDRTRRDGMTSLTRGGADAAGTIVAPRRMTDKMGQRERLNRHNERQRQHHPQTRPPG